jgi:Tfp pilus assembly major pilin PilA
MKDQRKSRQGGFSLLGFIFVAGVLASVGILGAQAFPTVLEYQAALKAVQKASAGNTVGEVKVIFDKAAQIDDIKSITGKDLEVTKEGEKTVVSFAYTKEIHLAGPAYLLLKYSNKSK